MKMTMRRVGAILLALAMIATMLPVFPLSVLAAGTLTVSDPNIGLSWTDASNSSGSAGWSASGTTITGTATGYKKIINLTVTTKLTITNNYAETRTLSFSYTLSGGGSVSGISGDAYSGELASGGSLTITLKSPSGPSTNTLTINDIRLVGNSNVTATFMPGENGSYTVDGTAITESKSYEKAPEASSYIVTATPNSGYSFYGWYDENSGGYMSYDAATVLIVSSNANIKPVFVSGNPAHFSVGAQRFYDLDEAIAVAQSGSVKKIVVVKDGVVTGSHTIPSGVTLLIPYDDAYSAYGANASCTSYSNITGAITGSTGNMTWVEPSPYRTLTLGANAHITVNGDVEVGGRHAACNGNAYMYGGSPTGKLGYIYMQADAHIDLNSGSHLYCWGYIYGDGTITAKNGSAIYENFQLQDFRGGDVSKDLAADEKVFPNSQYYVQNIEVATRYEYGSTEYVVTSIYMSYMQYSATVEFIGDSAMFRPQPGSYVIKDYIPEDDVLKLEAYGDCALASLSMEIADIPVDSAQYVLPITNNIHIFIREGTATLQQNVMMLPGSALTVDQGATLNIGYTSNTINTVQNGGYVLQVFDKDNYTWGINQSTGAEQSGLYYVHANSGTGILGETLHYDIIHPVPYTCTARKSRTGSTLEDVKLDINGTIISNGFIYSTVRLQDNTDKNSAVISGGANITSSNGTGRLVMANGAGEEQYAVMYVQDRATGYYNIPLASAQLKNGDGTLLDTRGAAPGTVFVYSDENDCWVQELYSEETPSSVTGEADTADTVGVAVKFTLDVSDVAIQANTEYYADITNATVTPLSVGVAYSLVGMGAVVSNNGVLPSLDAVAAGTYGTRMIDIPAEKVWELTADTASFAVRVVKIPNTAANRDTAIWFRPYYIFEDGNGNRITVYGDVAIESYNSANAAQ